MSKFLAYRLVNLNRTTEHRYWISSDGDGEPVTLEYITPVVEVRSFSTEKELSEFLDNNKNFVVERDGMLRFPRRQV